MDHLTTTKSLEGEKTLRTLFASSCDHTAENPTNYLKRQHLGGTENAQEKWASNRPHLSVTPFNRLPLLFWHLRWTNCPKKESCTSTEKGILVFEA